MVLLGSVVHAATARTRIPPTQPAKTALFAGGQQGRSPRELFRAN
jgi:hypothetical protein